MKCSKCGGVGQLITGLSGGESGLKTGWNECSMCKGSGKIVDEPAQVKHPERDVSSRWDVYAAIEETLAKYPSMRIGQLLSNMAHDVEDLFYKENRDLAKIIRKYPDYQK